MTDKEYLNQMIGINEELERIASNKPLNMDEWQKAMYEMHRVNNVWYHSRRRRDWFTKASIVFLALVLAWSFYKICCLLRFLCDSLLPIRYVG